MMRYNRDFRNLARTDHNIITPPGRPGERDNFIFTSTSSYFGPIKRERKYLPTLSELVDRLSIVQLKEVFITDHKREYGDEISDIYKALRTKTRKTRNHERQLGNHLLYRLRLGW